MPDDLAHDVASDTQEQESSAEERVEDRQEDPVAALAAELAQAREVLIKREGEVTRLTEALAQVQGTLEEQAQHTEHVEEELHRTLARYRSALLETSPDVPAELVQGEDVEALEHSLAQAQQLVVRVRQQLEAKVAAERVPPGAPIRSGPDLSSLSTREKIVHALSRLRWTPSVGQDWGEIKRGSRRSYAVYQCCVW